jgi:hypothetical protein
MLRQSRPPRLLALLVLLSALDSAPAWAAPEPQPSPAAPGGLALELKVEKTRIYLHEPTILSVTLLSGPETPRNIGYPRLSAPGFRLGEFGLPVQQSGVRDGVEFNSYQFRATLTPQKSGTLQLDPAQLDCELLAPAAGPAAFFGGTEAKRMTLRSAALPLTVLPLPREGRPAGFSGAVGRFTLTRVARPAVLQAGDPVTVRTIIRGSGNLGAFSCNAIAAPGLTSFAPRRELSANALACEQVVIPETANVREVPAVGISFFDPGKERYRTATCAALPLRVSAPVAPAAPARPPLPRAEPASPPKRLALMPGSGYLAAGLLLAAALGGTLLKLPVRRRRDPRAASDAAPPPNFRELLSQAQAAEDAGDAATLYRTIFRALQAGLGNRLQLPAAGLTASFCPDALPEPLLQDAGQLFCQCDRVRYGKHSPSSAEMRADLQKMQAMSIYF